MLPFEEEIHIERLGWFIHLRWVAVAGGLALLLVGPYIIPLDIKYGPLVFCLMALGILNAAYLWYWERLRKQPVPEPVFLGKARLFLHLQMVADLLLLTLMLFLGGGAENPLILFFLFHLAIGTLVFSIRESLFYAGCALALPWALYLAEGWGPAESLWQNPEGLSGIRERSILLAYSATVAGLWFFLSRLALDIRAKEASLRWTHEQLRGDKEQLEQLDAYKNQFLNQVVFHLKSPTIDMDFDLSAVDRALPQNNTRARDAVKEAKKRVWTLLEMIDDLTWLSRMKAHDVPFKKEWLDVYEALLKRLQVTEGEAGKKGITFKLHGDAQVRIRADREAFDRVAGNLISNAVKYTPPGTHEVLVEFQVAGDLLRLSVKDEGIGIPPKQQEKIFDEFFRASNAKTLEKSGTGLGLTIVKWIMDWHGGKVDITSAPGQGTKVETWWPVGESVREMLHSESPALERRVRERTGP